MKLFLVLLTDFVILGSYEIDLYKTNNESLNLNNYFFFNNVSSYIKRIIIICFNCTNENPTEIAIKDQRISFWIDREINFINLNFTGVDMNLNFNETLHKSCYFWRDGCCNNLNSCLMDKTYFVFHLVLFY